ncbi:MULTISPECIES: hypothetical protein [Mesorhizobium]|uniref:hypothetical protein n=1 Tax=Mesorhizobium TaxID=68287 RepID=UPI001056422D|nr:MULTISPECIES: hypothetical protein [Mesorhizobium]
MQYVVTEIMDSVELLQAHVDKISENKGKVISVIWRDSDRVYVVTHGFEIATASKKGQKGD